ncbi:MAG: hypothetical protein IKE24_01870 [Clostridia bacterium]|nr:hypothetical protein [Clostridia bacterium]
MKFRKWMGLLLAAVMIGSGCCAAAEGEISLLYEAGRQLLTATTNVTVQGSADFYLDGTHFKNARGAYIQNGEEAFQTITLRGPDNEGKDRENGYAVLTLDGLALVAELYHGKDHRWSLYTQANETILRQDRKIENLLWMGQLAAAELDRALMDMVEEKDTEEGRTYSWTAEEGDMPDWLQYALNRLWNEGISRYYWAGYENMTPYAFGEIGEYATPTEGIIMTTREITVHDMEIHASLDDEKHLSGIGGTVQMRLTEASGATHELMVAFSVSMDQYGESSIRENALVRERMGDALDGQWPGQSIDEDGGNEELDGFEALPELDLPLSAPPALPDFQGKVTPRTLSGEQDLIAYAREVWALDYLAAGDLEGYTWTVRPGDGDRFIVTGVLPGQEETAGLELETDGNGWIYRLQNKGTGEQFAEVFYSETWSEADWDGYNTEPIVVCQNLVEALNPGNGEKAAEMRGGNDSEFGLYNPGFGGFGVAGDNYFMLYYSDPAVGSAERLSRMKFVYQIYPVVRFVEYNELIDPLEGGNG